MNPVIFVASRLRDQTGEQWVPVGRLERVPGGYRFVYTRGAKKLRGFHPFPNMQDLHAIYESDELFPLFANRMLAPSRPEYEAYLNWAGFGLDNPPDPIALLAITEGKRATDQLEVFPCPMPDSSGCYVTKFFLHGIRYMAEAAQKAMDHLYPGQPLALMLDFMNRYDPHAVAVRTDDDQRWMLGYVPRYLARDIGKLCWECGPDTFRVTVERVNRDAPLQQRLLCRLRACWPEDFRPCNDEEFQPLAPASN
jgi:hypothetical protein